MTIHCTPDSPEDVLTRVTIVGSNGDRHEVVATCAPYALADGSTIRGIAPWAVSSRPIGPEVAGEEVTRVRATARTFGVNVTVAGTTAAGHADALADLGALLTPEQGPCRLEYERPDGTKRALTCHYIGGADGLTASELHRVRHHDVTLVFRAHFPFWVDADETLQTVGPFTFVDGMSSLVTEVEVTNTGDAGTWPEFIITGHAEGIEFANLTTGEIWRVTEVIEEGSELRIDTDPRAFTVLVDQVPNYLATDPTSQWWKLVPGVNQLLIRAHTTGTQVIGTWEIRFMPFYQSS